MNGKKINRRDIYIDKLHLMMEIISEQPIHENKTQENSDVDLESRDHISSQKFDSRRSSVASSASSDSHSDVVGGERNHALQQKRGSVALRRGSSAVNVYLKMDLKSR